MVQQSAPPAWTDLDSLKSSLQASGQGHLVAALTHLKDTDQAELLSSIQKFDYGYVSRAFQASISAADAAATQQQGALQPFRTVLQLKDQAAGSHAEWQSHGLKLVAQGKVAVLLLAGGQGTRLGSSLPKGTYDIGLPSRKSLFHLQAERVLRLQQLAAAEWVRAGGLPAACKPLLWVIMTSPFTHQDTLQHFHQHAFFGLQEAQVIFFQQGALPCLDQSGKVILSTPTTLAKAPDGNGGVYMSLHNCGVLSRLQAAGVEAVDCYCVDNALARLGDPLFVGYCHLQGAEVGARVVAKAGPDEKVGVFASRAGALQVIEYSEMSPEQATAVDADSGQLQYNWGNICMHYFSLAWLQQVTEHLQKGAAYHIAHKKIPSVDGPVQGIKLELFIFDTFATASRVCLVEVDRAAQFAPVKNAPGSASDSPDAARAATLALGAAWVRAAGGKLTLPADSMDEGVEVSPLVSYAGEGLEALVAGRTITSPADPALMGLAAL